MGSQVEPTRFRTWMEGREKPQVGLEPMWGWGKGGGGGLAPAGKYNLQGGPSLPSSLEPGILFSCQDGAPLNQNI